MAGSSHDSLAPSQGDGQPQLLATTMAEYSHDLLAPSQEDWRAPPLVHPIPAAMGFRVAMMNVGGPGSEDNFVSGGLLYEQKLREQIVVLQ